LTLLDCSNLKACDEYFEKIFAGSENPKILGCVELSESELEHLTRLISSEACKYSFAPSVSLSIAVFLVWMGILHYQDGNFWPPVFEALRISSHRQRHCQIALGETFERTVKRYGLIDFDGGLRYVTPILAHGFVPNTYLEEYFNSVVFPIYRERKSAGLKIGYAETQHIVEEWRKEYARYQRLKESIVQFEAKEEQLMLALDVCNNAETLKRLKELRLQLNNSEDITRLLPLSENWLEEAERQRDYYKYQLENLNEVLEVKRHIDFELTALDRAISNAASKILRYWDDDVQSAVMAISVDVIEKLIEGLTKMDRSFFGFWRRPSKRNLLCRVYSRIENTRHLLYKRLAPLPLKTEVLQKPDVRLCDVLRELQTLFEQRRKLKRVMDNIKEPEQEVAAALHETALSTDLTSDQMLLDGTISFYQKRLQELNAKIAAYKKSLIRLGKGRLEDGMEVLVQQRNLRKEIDELKSRISANHDVEVLLQHLSMAKRYADKDDMVDKLNRIRRYKEAFAQKLNEKVEPLYYLNESTRLFLFQGGEVAEKFLFNSLLLMEKLDAQDGELEQVELPFRVVDAMSKWWQDRGKYMLDACRDMKNWESEQAVEDVDEVGSGIETGACDVAARELTMRHPSIVLDTFGCCIKVELPEQRVSGPYRVTFRIIDEEEVLGSIDLLVIRAGDEYYTRRQSLVLEKPLPAYTLELDYGYAVQKCTVKGCHPNENYLIFSKDGYLLEDIRPGDEGVYVVAPQGVDFSPHQAVIERGQLVGHWSGYEYFYIDLSDAGTILMRIQDREYVLERPVKQKSHLKGGNELFGVKSSGWPVYSGQLPVLVFSIKRHEDLGSYGLRLDWAGGTKYVKLDQMKVNKDGDLVSVPLSHIAGEVFGQCKVALFYGYGVVWSGQFAIINGLDIAFDKRLYLPEVEMVSDDWSGLRYGEQGKEKVKQGWLKIKSLERFALDVASPARLVESDGIEHLIEFDAAQSDVSVTLKRIVGGKECSVPLLISIPKVCWRLNDESEWRFDIDEIWYEDARELYVKLPFRKASGIRLALVQIQRARYGKSGKPSVKVLQFISPSVRRGIAVFNLRKFNDSLRESQQPLLDLMLYFEDPDIQPCMLARIRVRWEIELLEIKQMREGKTRRVVIKWRDLGKSSDRVIRLWPVDIPGINMLEYQIPDSISEKEIVETVERLPAGIYTLQFAVNDPWADEKPEYPGIDAENCQNVVIGDAEEALQEVLSCGLEIVGFEYEGKTFSTGNIYWICDIEPYPELEGENGFMGNVYMLDAQGNRVAMDYNPVSFYLDWEIDRFSRLPFLIDRDRDGAQYCRRCDELFWDIAHIECGSQVIVPDYILIKVRRNKDGAGSSESY